MATTATPEEANSLVQRGYVIYDVLSSQEASVLSEAAINHVYNRFLRGKCDPLLLVDPKHRTRVFGTGLRDDVLHRWRSCTQYVYDKSSGLVDSFLMPWSIKLHLDGRVTDKVSHLYSALPHHYLVDEPGTVLDDQLRGLEPQPVAYTYGLERYGVKVQGCPEDTIHLDTAVYRGDARSSTDAANHTLSTVLCSAVDLQCPIRASGCMEVLANAHHYHEVLSLLMRGQRLVTSTESWRIYQSLLDSRLEPYAEVDERFDSILEWFNEQLATYTTIYNAAMRDEGTPNDDELRDELLDVIGILTNEKDPCGRRKGELPWCPRVFRPLVWTPLRVQPGQAITYDTRLPYRTTAVGSSIAAKKTTKVVSPYVYHQLRLRQMQDDYYLSPLHGNVRAEMASGSMTIQGKSYPATDNERGWMMGSLVPDETFRHYADTISSLSERDRRLLCIQPYPGFYVHPSRRGSEAQRDNRRRQ